MSAICSLLSFFKLKFHSWNQSVAEVPPSLLSVRFLNRRDDEKTASFSVSSNLIKNIYNILLVYKECDGPWVNQTPKMCFPHWAERKQGYFFIYLHLTNGHLHTNGHIQSHVLSLNCGGSWFSNLYQHILMSSLCSMTLHVCSKLIMTFFVKALRVRRAFQMRSNPAIMLSSPHTSTSVITRACQVPKWVWCTIQQAFAYVKKDNRLLWE